MTDDTTAQVGDFISDNPDFMDALAVAQEKLFVARDRGRDCRLRPFRLPI